MGNDCSRPIYVLKESQKEYREKESESLFNEIMTKNFIKMGKEMDIEIEEAQ